MKTSQRKKIIIGYRYDPQSYTSQRLCQVQTIQGQQFNDQYLPTDGVKQSFQADQKVIERLRNQNCLLRAQLERMQQKSSFRSYKILSRQYEQLQGEYSKMRQQVQELKVTIKQFEKRQQQQQRQSQKYLSNITNLPIQQQQHVIPVTRTTTRNYTFSINSTTNNNNTNDDIKQSQKRPQQYFYQKLNSIQTNRNTTVDQSVQHRDRYNDMLSRQSQHNNNNIQSLMMMNNNNNASNHSYKQQSQSSQQSNDKSYKHHHHNSYSYNPLVQNTFKGGIDTEYMYNDLRTIQSQKSQQLQSQIHLGYNFSFMPQPLKKNIKTLQAFDQQQQEHNNISKKQPMYKDHVKQATVTFASSHKQIVNHNISSSNSNRRQQQQQVPYFQNSISQQSLYMSENQSQTNISKLNGLKKLPSKPMRNQRTSNNSINLSDG